MHAERVLDLRTPSAVALPSVTQTAGSGASGAFWQIYLGFLPLCA